jgi:uncharacterized protein (TIGR03083 family)
MDTDRYLGAIRDDGAALAAAARAAGLGVAVPSCPGWTVADLVEHTGLVHRHKAAIVRHRLDARPEEPPGPPRGPGLLDWYSDGLGELLDVLAGTSPATPVWTWHPPDQTAGFWRRRMAHETAVHRVDAEQAVPDLGAGRATVEPWLAADGVDEVLTVFMGDDPDSDQLGGRVGTLRVLAVDADGDWLATLHANALVVAPGPADPDAKADATVRGQASDLLLWLWGRGQLGRLDASGDPAVVAGVRALAAEVTV